MPVTMLEQGDRKTLAITMRGKLTKADYDTFIPQIETLYEREGKLNFLIKLEDFKGIEIGALWQDIKFDVKHFDDVERLAIVGEDGWMRWMTELSRPFTSAEVRYFEPDRSEEALDWVSGSTVSKR